MKIPGTFERFGGVDTKLKIDPKKYLKFAAALTAGMFLCFLLYDLLDRVWNGLFVDWFTGRYMIRQTVTDAQGIAHNCWQMNWNAVKGLLFRTLLFLVALGTVSIYAAYGRIARQERRRVIEEAAELIERSLSHPEEEDRFPKEYERIGLLTGKLKTDMRRKEQALREEAARKDDLITYLAHDLKTPLTSVIGYLSLLDEAKDMPGEQREKYVGIVLKKARRLEGLINEFFEITRYNLQQIILEKERVDLVFLLLQLADEFYPLLQAHGNTVRLDLEDGLTVYGDPEKLARVFQNLMKNAVAYSYENTEILLEARAVSDRVRVSVRNHGRTIPKQKLGSLFEKFFRLDDARTSDTGGAGLGLAIARDIVLLHGGTIGAQSENEETVFTVELERMPEERAGTAGEGHAAGKERSGYE